MAGEIGAADANGDGNGAADADGECFPAVQFFRDIDQHPLSPSQFLYVEGHCSAGGRLEAWRWSRRPIYSRQGWPPTAFGSMASGFRVSCLCLLCFRIWTVLEEVPPGRGAFIREFLGELVAVWVPKFYDWRRFVGLVFWMASQRSALHVVFLVREIVGRLISGRFSAAVPMQRGAGSNPLSNLAELAVRRYSYLAASEVSVVLRAILEVGCIFVSFFPS